MQKNHKKTSEYIFAILKARIVSLEYPPGMPLNDKEIGKEFGVSRTPVREAIKKLEHEGLVTVLPRYSTTVSLIEINDIRWAFDVRLRLEGLAGAEAAKGLSSSQLVEMKNIIYMLRELAQKNPQDLKQVSTLHGEFHKILYEGSQNPILCDILNSLHSRCARACNAYLNRRHHSSCDLDQLQAIYQALVNRDTEQAACLCESHVQSVMNRLKNALL